MFETWRIFLTRVTAITTDERRLGDPRINGGDSLIAQGKKVYLLESLKRQDLENMPPGRASVSHAEWLLDLINIAPSFSYFETSSSFMNWFLLGRPS